MTSLLVFGTVTMSATVTNTETDIVTLPLVAIWELGGPKDRRRAPGGC